MVLVDALFIANMGGGPSLLRYLIDAIKQRSLENEFFFLLDKRFEHDIAGFTYQCLPGSLRNRYRFYKKNKEKFRRIFCFANTPPPIKCEVPVATYFHNMLLIESEKHPFKKGFWGSYLRFQFVRLFNKNTDEYIVQTSHVAEAIVGAGLKKKKQCKAFPFFRIAETQTSNGMRANEFVYVSTPTFYKNYENLFEAWEVLCHEGYNPALHVTVDELSPELLKRTKDMAARGINIVNHGYTNPGPLYQKCKYLIYPSYYESFGLGLVEGAKAGLKVLAADLPYVSSVVVPSASFNPDSPTDIAATVKHALTEELSETTVCVEDKVHDLIDYLLN
jgi:glycosyltransferase involved in cell wall biosynthesis